MEKKGLKVILADNNIQDRETRTKAVEEAGMQVVYSTGDGKKALDAILRERPDIVVMDMILPGLDGMGILEEIEKEEMHYKPVVLIVTALKMSQMVTKALQNGADYYMMKPISNKVFGKRIIQISEEIDQRFGVAADKTKEAVWDEKNEYAASDENSTAARTIRNSENIISMESKTALLAERKNNCHSRYSGDLEKDITNVLLEIGIPAHIKGYQYIRQGIIMSFNDRSMLQYITKYLYPAIAKKNKTTSSSVERTIRHAIEVAWRRGSMEVLEEIFGNTVCAGKGKPTNSEFLALLTDKFRLEYREKIVS